ncbi:MAG: twitching motility protein PilT [Treponema sp. GWC1_61_84]|nr:MAG: twitching motility protein PilT [Treponema sp. GWC1_61_84]
MFHPEPGNGPGKNYTVSKIFIDTNVFLYLLDNKDETKREKARKILKKIVALHQPVLSTQVIKEFYVAATSKLKADSFIVKNIIHNFRNMEIVNNDLELIEQAIDISAISQISFWDSLIVAAAEKANCEFIFSEDLNSGQTYRGVKVVNPFEKADF